MSTTVSKSKFKARALQFFREVEQFGEELIITDHGNPVLKIIPYRDNSKDALKHLRGSVLEFQDPLEPVGEEDWEALK